MDLLLSLRQSRTWNGFPHFMRRIYFSCVSYSRAGMLLFCSIIKLPADSTNNHMETYLKVK